MTGKTDGNSFPRSPVGMPSSTLCVAPARQKEGRRASGTAFPRRQHTALPTSRKSGSMTGFLSPEGATDASPGREPWEWMVVYMCGSTRIMSPERATDDGDRVCRPFRAWKSWEGATTNPGLEALG